MPQVNYTVQGGDTLPSIAEACGHPGEWTAIVETASWLEGLDYLAVPPGTEILLPMDWAPGPAAEETLGEQAELSGQAPTSSMTASELIGMAQVATTEAQLDAISAAANGRVTVLDAVTERAAQLGLP